MNNQDYVLRGGKEWKKIARSIRKERGGDCEKCKNRHGYRDNVVHHIVPLIDGGTNDPDNLVVLCYTCHYFEHHPKAQVIG